LEDLLVCSSCGACNHFYHQKGCFNSKPLPFRFGSPPPPWYQCRRCFPLILLEHLSQSSIIPAPQRRALKGCLISGVAEEVSILSPPTLRMTSHLHVYKCIPNSNIQNRSKNQKREERDRARLLRRLDQVIYHQHKSH
jgi:hypothetical protein